MHLSRVRNIPLNIYCSVEEHDEAKRREFVEELNRLGVQPEFHGDKIEFRYRGGRETVLKLASYAEAHQAHSINITSGAV